MWREIQLAWFILAGPGQSALNVMAVRTGRRPKSARSTDQRSSRCTAVGTNRCPVPTLLLQPLVENAFRHGVEQHAGVGTVSVRSRRAAGAQPPADRRPEAAVLVAATLLVCFAGFEAARRVGWLRPWMGLEPRLDAAPARLVPGACQLP